MLARNKQSFSFSMYSSFSSVDSNSSNKSNKSAKTMFSNDIFRAIKENNKFKLSSLFVENDMDIEIFNRPNKLSVTPLILAISLQRLDCIQTLIDMGVDVNKQDQMENTPLHIACIDGKPKIVKMLLDNDKVNINVLNCFHECPIIAACSGNSTECVKLLLDYNSYPHRRDNKGNSAIHIACEYGNIEIIKLLLNRGVSINCQNSHGKTPLYVACMEKQLNCVLFLINAGADVNIPDNEGRTPLMACYEPKIKQILRKHGGKTGCNTLEKIDII